MKATTTKFKDIEALSYLMDSKFKIFGFRFGLDGLVGLIPFFGDLLTSLVSLYIVFRAFFSGVPLVIVIMMLVNILIEYVVGLVPILGNIFDFFWKSNIKNINLIKNYQNTPTQIKKRSAISLFCFFILLLGAFLGAVYIAVKLMIWIFSLIF